MIKIFPSTIIIPTILPLHNPNPFFIHLIIVNGKKNPSQVFKNTSVDNTTPVDNTLNHIILTDGSRSISRDNENACRSRRSVITSRAPYIPPPWTKQPRITRKIGFRPRGSRRAVEHVIGNVESISLLLGATLGYIEGVNIFARHV